MPHIICVGAVYMDTILSIPHFPKEDEKLRATNLIRRRGGNTANTLEVISQLLPAHNFDSETSTYSTELSLLTVLPDQTSPDTQVVISSLPDVSTRLFQYRQGQQVAASSYIMQSAANLTRTIISANPLEEMTVEEFKGAIKPLITADIGKEDVWIHFEGRIPEVLLQCVTWLRQKYGYHGKVRVSVECEKPDRIGMKDVAALADVVFYSRIWAEAHSDTSTCAPPITASSFLNSQLPLTHPNATLICTWGSSGAEALRKTTNGPTLSASESGWRPSADQAGQPIDTVGAGDTFIAGMLYTLVEQPKWGIDERLAFANELAGRKVYRQGFSGLGEEIKGCERWGEKLAKRPQPG
ncbi:ketohexokinase-like protein [Macroventuria anomochaeta]|uniref:Ketohexokinase-like protein n=1 Tax=Macroventuria anomochaeta TaxID=301207 RepID=A0ACB6RWE0_9PLEO|nr:ketohexokinase-like protein [Macroventuria anomochaeta]KAF2626012.1 ketohexokinase-like protein [Macroventuria anomochaeta]